MSQEEVPGGGLLCPEGILGLPMVVTYGGIMVISGLVVRWLPVLTVDFRNLVRI
jgi:hypothetical protein